MNSFLLKLMILLFATPLISTCSSSSSDLNELKGKVDFLNLKNKEISGELAKAKLDILEIKMQSLPPSIDISTDSVQRINNAFSVVDLNSIKHLAGLRISGRIINKHSVAYKSLSFYVTSYDGEKDHKADFFISQVYPGQSATFSFYLPEVKETTKFITIEQGKSVVSFGSGKSW